MPPIPSEIKDWIQVSVWIIGGGGALFAAFKGLAELGRARKQREEDLKWKRAEAAKKLIDEMCNNQAAADAMQILEWPGYMFVASINGTPEKITRTDMRSALIPKEKFSASDMFICERMDGLFWYFAFLEHHITTGLVLDDQVRFPAEYYVNELAYDYDVVTAYLEQHELLGAKKFLERFDEWNRVVSEDRGPEASPDDLFEGTEAAPKRWLPPPID